MSVTAIPRPYVSLTGILTQEDVEIVMAQSQVFDDHPRHLLFAGFLIGPRSWRADPRDRKKYLDLSSPASITKAAEMTETLRAWGFNCIAHLCDITHWENDTDWREVAWDGIQVNGTLLDDVERLSSAIRQFQNCIHQLHEGLMAAHSLDYLMGFWRGLTGKGSRILYDMSRGKGVKVREENLREFVRMYVDFAVEGMALGLAGGIDGHSLEHVVGTLRKYGFDPRNLSIDSESGVMRITGRGLDERKVEQYYSEAARLIVGRRGDWIKARIDEHGVGMTPPIDKHEATG